MDRDVRHALVLLAAFATAGAFLLLVFVPILDPAVEAVAAARVSPTGPADEGPLYAPPALQDAPPALRPLVEEGRRLMDRTDVLLPDHVGNALTCTSCHFEGGRTRGGRNGGLSLVGTAARYPRVRKGAPVDLAGRINQCMTDSMAGEPLSAGSREMLALVAWIHWIGEGVPLYAEVPWIDLPPAPRVAAAGLPDGRRTFERRCAMCHGLEGGGTPVAPPLWGRQAFTAAAGMARYEVFMPFALWNMPRENPLLSPEEAAAVARYVLDQPRPKGS